MSFTQGQRVLIVTGSGWGSTPDSGYFATIDKVSPTGIVTIGDKMYRPDGFGRGKTYGRIREPQDGDDAIDATYRERVKANRIEQARTKLAWNIAGVSGNQWVKASAEDLDIVAGILRKIGALT